VGGDFLLIYKLKAGSDNIVFVRTGTPAELFE
jgi:mRNA-degrading endonuclease YafQ of YafQ-DinJ toxin-antitoxin module